MCAVEGKVKLPDVTRLKGLAIMMVSFIVALVGFGIGWLGFLQIGWLIALIGIAGGFVGFGLHLKALLKRR